MKCSSIIIVLLLAIILPTSVQAGIPYITESDSPDNISSVSSTDDSDTAGWHPVLYAWRNSPLSIGIPFQIGSSAVTSIGISIELNLLRVAHVEVIQSVAWSIPFQLRCKIYPFDSLGIFFGGGYFRLHGYGDQGNKPEVVYDNVDGPEFFAGFRLPLLISMEVGYRFSGERWGIRNYYANHMPPVTSSEDLYLKEFYFSLELILYNF
jgi:hypothetical protein